MGILGIAMPARPKTKHSAPIEPIVVSAKTIAHKISTSTRYVHVLHEQGKIPGIRFGKGCIRFNEADVFAALGIKQEGAAQ